MPTIVERAQRVLKHEQNTGYADIAVKPGGLARFFAQWSPEASAAGLSHVERLVTMFEGYAALDPMQRAAFVRAALSLLSTEAEIQPAPPPIAKPVAPAPVKTGPPRATPADAAQKPKPPATTKPKKAESVSPALPVGEYLIDAPVTVVSGVGAVQAEKFERVGIRTIRDLLYYLPREHLDYSAMLPIGSLPFDELMTTKGVIWEVENVRAGNAKMVRTVARIADESGQMRAVWFNQPYLQKQLPRGAQIVVTGVKQRFGNSVQFTVKSHELPEQADLLNTGRLVPVYPLTEGLSAKTLRRATKWAVDRCATLVADYLPVMVRDSADMMTLPRALAQYHYPENGTILHQARHRLAFDEMFVIQLGMLARKANWHTGPAAPQLISGRSRILAGMAEDREPVGVALTPSMTPMSLWAMPETTAQSFEESLPFTLTEAQRRVINEVLDDLALPMPMCRLIQGDVGSGKTVVAAAALLAATLNGYQGAIMAPTEILAEQHARGLTRMLEAFGINVAVLLGSQKTRARNEALAMIASGQAQVVVGTHALIQEGVEFARLGVAVVDEQHRFGVEQRELLRRKGGGHSPHLLVMTATPIPRTLALSVYGDLDLSIIDQMPKGRLPIITRWRSGTRRDEAYHLMGAEVAAGRQGYIICALIEESETLEVKAAVKEYERLQSEVFPNLRIGLVHGALKPAEKDATMRRFRDGEIDILVATAVVEVGVDVPNATIMIIEDADRFGLAQLHQFRGRVGRGEYQSYCYLLSQDAGVNARERLTVIEQTTDGLKLAEADLHLRGPGEFFGTRQSGLPELRVAEITDAPLVALARQEAEALWQRDPFLRSIEHAPLRQRMALFWGGFMGQ